MFDDAMERDVFSGVKVGPALSEAEAVARGLSADSLGLKLEEVYTKYAAEDPEAHARRVWTAEAVGVPQWIQERDEMYAKEAERRLALLTKGMPDWRGLSEKYPLTARFFEDEDVMASANDDVEALAAKEGEARRAGAVAKALRGKLSRGGAGRMAAAAAMRNMPKIYREEPEEGLSLGMRSALDARRMEAGRERYSQRMPISDEAGRAALSAAAKDLSFVNDFLSGSPFGKGASAGYEMASISSEAGDLFAAEAFLGRKDEARWVALEKRMLALDRDKPEGWFSGLLYETGKFYGQQARGAWTTGAMGATGAALGAYAASLGAALPGAASFGMTSGALAGAGAAAIVGAAPVLPAVAAAVFTAAAGWWLGAKLGVFTQAAKTEAGLDLIERRMMTDEEGNHLSNLSIGLGSMAVGAVNGALELFEWETAGRPFLSVARRAVPQATLSTVSAAVTRRLAKLPAAAKITALAAKDWGINVFTESMTEVMQDLVPITIDEMQKYALLDGYDMRTLGEVNAQLRETFVSSLYSFSLISALGPAGGFANRGARYRVELARRELEAAETMRLNRTLDSFAERLFATKLLKRFPGMSREHTQRILEGADLSRAYMSASAVETLFQEARKDEGAAAADYESAKEWAVEVLGVDEEDYDRSLDEGYKMEIAAAKVFEAAGDGDAVMEALNRELSWSRDGMTFSEAEEAGRKAAELRTRDFFKLAPQLELEALEERSARKLYEAARMQFEEEGVERETAAAWAWVKSRVYIPLARMYSDAMPKEAEKAAKRGGRELGRFLPEDVERMFPMVIERGEDGKPKGLAFTQAPWSKNGAVTRTEAFKAWFGDWENDPENASRILDSNGEPLAAYRGDAAGMTSFGSAQGNYFISDKDTAEGYAGKKGSLYPVYLNIRNPFVFSEENVASLKEALSARFDDWFDMDDSELAHDGDFQRLRELYAAFRNDEGSVVRNLYNDFLPQMDESMDDEEARDLMGRSLHDFYAFEARQLDFRDMDILNPYLRMLGFDGMIRPYDPLATDGGKSEYITFSPEQVKSVENTGTFDANDSNIYLQPVNTDVNPNQKVKVVDLRSVKVPKDIKTLKDLKAYLLNLPEGHFSTADSKAIIDVLHVNADHIAFTRFPLRKINIPQKEHVTARNKSIVSLKDLIENSVLVESVPNTKVKPITKSMSKGQVNKTLRKNRKSVYHRFYVPITIDGGNFYVVRLVAEEDGKVITINPTKVDLYDVIIEDKKTEKLSALLSPEGPNAALSGSLMVSIHDLLKNVPDYQGNPYFTQPSRGSIAFPAYDGGPVRITLGKGADRSTFTHELAHLYLWHLKRLAALDVTYNRAAWTGPTARWNDDLKVVSGWWGENAESIARQAAEFESRSGTALSCYH
ncbi:hypothetical protein [Synergistes jonesii]|uniref:Large polyvalent protein associated domain-containing protein n=1 Tax=Synergistes jonesii TaxID=2754 RepID=A0A073ITB4_9BACT|nr:hypothetical protein [Synergistes jonesii]KEJ92726.1 hypothetical protein EH55_01305 [Synergistes jonesii]OFB61283.1 hypothetical protein JS72_11155 [Synergistes jonesii]OFB63674.1 hypothetical protein JS73_04600 [Synergistes jonesii]OFB64534.1 hypothetical protein JS79_05155 [Synergistes jonesii]OFB68193.1 hypothetical protein JS78_04620 [Synergistes jonesii]